MLISIFYCLNLEWDKSWKLTGTLSFVEKTDTEHRACPGMERKHWNFQHNWQYNWKLFKEINYISKSQILQYWENKWVLMEDDYPQGFLGFNLLDKSISATASHLSVVRKLKNALYFADKVFLFSCILHMNNFSHTHKIWKWNCIIQNSIGQSNEFSNIHWEAEWNDEWFV